MTVNVRVPEALSLRDQMVAVASAVPGLIYSFRLSPDGVASMPFASAGIEEIFGIPAEEVVRDFGTDAIIHGDDLQRVRDSIHESAHTLLPWRQEFRVLHPRKGVLWIEAHSIPTAEEDGSVLWHGYMQDVTERKFADEAIHHKTQLLYAQQEASTDGLLVVNSDFSISSMNSRFVEIWGIPQDLIDRKDHEAILEHGRAQFADQESFRWDTEELYSRPGEKSHHEYALKDGRTIERRSFPFFGPDGTCCGRLWVFRDMTEARRAATALQESERFARSTLDSLLAHIAILDADGKILAVNAAWRAFAECNSTSTSALLEGANYLATCDAVRGSGREDARAIAEGIRAVLAGSQEGFSLEYPCHSSTERSWFCGRVTRFKGEGPLRLVVAHENITDRVIALEELRMSKALLTEMGRLAKVGGWEMDPATGTGTWTEETARIHGMNSGERTSEEEVLALYPPESRRALVEAQTAAMVEGRPYDLELELDAADGNRKWVRVIAHPEMKHDRVIKLHGSYQDITDRKAVDLALRESEALLTQMGRVAKIGGWEADLVAGTRTWTAETARINGVAMNVPMSAERAIDFYVGESRKRMLEAVSKAAQEGRPFDLESEFESADGVRKWVRTIGVPEMKDGQPVKIRGSLQDISDRKRVDLALRESEALLTEMGRMAKVGGWEMDPIAGTRSWTEETARIHGLNADAPMSVERGIDFYVGESREAIRKALKAAVDQGIPYDLELEMQTADGVHKWVRSIGKPVVEDGRVIKVRGALQDVTERKQADLALRESEALLSTIFRVTPVAISIFRLSDGTSMMLNEGFTALTGFSREEAIGRTNSEVGICVDPGLQTRMLQMIENNDGPHTGNAQIRTKSGELKDILASIYPLTLNGERAAITVATDITEIKRAEAEMKSLQEQFLQAQKMEAIGQLAGGVAHDFNNLLQVINSYSERIAEDYPHDGMLTYYGQSIQQAGQMAANLTRQLLAFSRNAPVRPRKVEVDVVLAGMVDMVRRLVGEDIKVELDLKAPAGWIEVDPSQIEQIVLNLAVNSRDAMPKGGLLRLSTAPGRSPAQDASGAQSGTWGFVELAVSDSGQGMDAETQKRVFEPFFTTKPVGQGTGLGLSTVYGVVEQFGGRIEIESSVGVGTRVAVTIPLVEGAEIKVEHKAAPAQAATEKAGAERILVVEDMANLRGLYAEGLRRFGYRVVTAEHGQEALSLVKTAPEPFDLVISDAIMPVMGGVELFETLRRMHPGLKLLLISGYAGDRLHQQETHAYGDVLAKPFSIGTFTGKVRQILDGTAAEE